MNENSYEFSIITEKYQNIPNLLSEMSKIENKEQYYEGEIITLKESVSSLKDQLLHSQKTITTLSEENRTLINKMDEREAEIQELNI